MVLTGAIISRIFFPEVSAASLRLATVRESLVHAGADVRVVTTNPPPGIHVEKDPNIARVPVLRDSEGYVKGYASYSSFDIQAFFRVLTMRKKDFLLVEPPPTTGTVVRIASAIRGTPYFWYAADVWSDATAGMEVPGIVKKIVRGLEKFTIRGASGCIAVSEGVAQRVHEMGAKSVKVIPNGADTNIFHPEVPSLSSDELRSIGIEKPFFIYAGTASKWQGADLFARAFEKYWVENHDAQLLYLTRGDSVHQLQEIASRLQRVAGEMGIGYAPMIVHSTVPAGEAARWQKQAVASCVSIQPNIGYDFAYPTKVLTALSCGTPVIYAGTGPANRDIRDSSLGLSVPYDEESVRDAMTVMLEVYRKGDSGRWDPISLHQWVRANRSMETTGGDVAQYIFDRLRKSS